MVDRRAADPAVFAPPDRAHPGAPSGAGNGGVSDARPVTATSQPARPASIVCVASLQPQKGQRHLVEACRLLRDRGRAVQCTFVGEGEERTALEALVHALGLEDVVTLPGAQPRDRVVAIVEAADVVAQPSIVLPSGKTEGIPVALMEALAAERAVVASEVSGIPELVVDEVTGVLVPPGDATALANAIERLLDDPALRARLGTAGRRRVLEEFDLHRNTALLAERFRQSVDAGRVAG